VFSPSSGVHSRTLTTDNVRMNTSYLLPFGAFLLVLILYIMRRRVRQGRKKGTF